MTYDPWDGCSDCGSHTCDAAVAAPLTTDEWFPPLPGHAGLIVTAYVRIVTRIRRHTTQEPAMSFHDFDFEAATLAHAFAEARQAALDTREITVDPAYAA